MTEMLGGGYGTGGYGGTLGGGRVGSAGLRRPKPAGLLAAAPSAAPPSAATVNLSDPPPVGRFGGGSHGSRPLLSDGGQAGALALGRRRVR